MEHAIWRRMIIVALLAASSALLGGCGVGYYWQASTGHLQLMRLRRPVPDVVADPDTTDDVRAKLLTASQALDFAHTELGLPDNGSYRQYADTGREFVVWNVVAAPEFALDARTWCFPVAGCISYRGYFAEDGARNYADGLREQGDDVFVGGVAAYSTLGRFEDPILNTMIDYADYALAGLIFHELSHQLVYVTDDSKFNEGFASFVEQEGLARWLRANDAEEEQRRYRLTLRRRGEVQSLFVDCREQLESLYGQDLSAADMRARKAAAFDDLTEAYRLLRAGWEEPPFFDHWFAGELNNARLASFSTYDEYVPAFAKMLLATNGNLENFYADVAALAALNAEERTQHMLALLGDE